MNDFAVAEKKRSTVGTIAPRHMKFQKKMEFQIKFHMKFQNNRRKQLEFQKNRGKKN